MKSLVWKTCRIHWGHLDISGFPSCKIAHFHMLIWAKRGSGLLVCLDFLIDCSWALDTGCNARLIKTKSRMQVFLLCLSKLWQSTIGTVLRKLLMVFHTHTLFLWCESLLFFVGKTDTNLSATYNIKSAPTYTRQFFTRITEVKIDFANKTRSEVWLWWNWKLRKISIMSCIIDNW